MCGKALYRKQKVFVGDQMIYTNHEGKIFSGTWGLGKPLQGIGRIESMRTVWKNMMPNRGILELDGFWEKDFFFHLNEGSLSIPILYNRDLDFLILTHKSKGVVASVHDRQPIIIKAGQENKWLDETMILQVDPMEIILDRKTRTTDNLKLEESKGNG